MEIKGLSDLDFNTHSSQHKNTMKKRIKSVKRNLTKYEPIAGGLWKSIISSHYGNYEIIPEEVIRNCSLFEVEYEKESEGHYD